jgi:hypothetical protein
MLKGEQSSTIAWDSIHPGARNLNLYRGRWGSQAAIRSL